MSIRQASKTHSIPLTTLHDRLKNENLGSPRLGRKPVFNVEQEEEIAIQVKLLGSLYYGLTVAELRKAVYEYAELNKIKHNFDNSSKSAGIDWVRGFMKRNPSVTVRKAEATSLNRISAFNKNEITLFYNMLGDLMEKHNFTPNNIYNADETGVTTVTDPGKVLAEKGQRRVGAVTSGERGRNITVMCAMSAAGNFIPPMFIFPRQRMTPLLEKNGPPGALYTNSKNGWINECLFVDWLKHFKAYARPTDESPVLLIIDNHSSHISLSAFNYCKENHIIMLSIPPHSSHRTQPLDVSFYGPLKAAYRQECNWHMKTHLMAKITPYDVAGLFNKAFAQVANISKGEAGFRATGIYPMNPNVFTEQDFLAATMMAEEQRQTEGPEVAEIPIQGCQSPSLIPSDDTMNNGHESLAPVSSHGTINHGLESPVPGPSQGHVSPVPGPSSQILNQRYESPVPGPSHKTLNQGSESPIPLDQTQRRTVAFADVATTPTFSQSTKPVARNRKQHAMILTATPMKTILEEKEAKKKNKNDKTKSKKTAKDKVTKKKTRSYKRKVLQDSSSEDDENQYLCNDDSDDDMVMNENDNICCICEEFGRNDEIWYRCTACGKWSHAMCSGWESAVGYICDFCK